MLKESAFLHTIFGGLGKYQCWMLPRMNPCHYLDYEIELEIVQRLSRPLLTTRVQERVSANSIASPSQSRRNVGHGEKVGVDLQ